MFILSLVAPELDAVNVLNIRRLSASLSSVPPHWIDPESAYVEFLVISGTQKFGPQVELKLSTVRRSVKVSSTVPPERMSVVGVSWWCGSGEGRWYRGWWS